MNAALLQDPFTGELDELELRVAKRADELASDIAPRRDARRDREAWLRAEEETFALADAGAIHVYPH
jgi:hypothetical protein